MTSSDAWHALLIFGSAFVLEDVAVLGAALLVVNNMITLPWAAGSSFAGLWLGDLALYLLALYFGRPILENRWFQRIFGKNLNLLKSEAWFRDHGTAAIAISRAIPGTRLPTYLMAGLLRIPVGRFLLVTAVACVLWVAALFWLTWHAGMMVLAQFAMFRTEAGKLAAIVVIAGSLGFLMRKVIKEGSFRNLRAGINRYVHWEFWPPGLFYAPVVAKYLLLALRYRSISLPTCANPGMQTGGLIGESKFDTLADLGRTQPDFTARTKLVRFVSIEQQADEILRAKDDLKLTFPLVLKPDVGQRGHGFRVIHSEIDARAYPAQFQSDVLIQQYIPGPEEAGVFYYRFPNQRHGKIFAITEKLFPVVTGDGEHTLEELIHRDRRAAMVAGTYLLRFAAQKDRVPPAGERIKLVEAGNHCQGAIFLDGRRLLSSELENRIDEISCSVSGFFVGRYDIRYTSETELQSGKGFQIIELNGISSEATSIYDPKNSLWKAYGTLFRQWEIIFAIAAENRKLGFPATSLRSIWENWTRYRSRSGSLSVSD